MRIWYQSMGRAGSWGGYSARLKDTIASAHRADTDVEIHGTRVGIAEQYHQLQHLASADLLANLDAAIRGRFDAFVIGNFFDPAISICREVTSMPVLGLGETSLHLACQIGRRPVVVAANAKAAARIREGIRQAGLETRIDRVVMLDMPRILDLKAGFTEPAASAAFCAALDAATPSDADVVIPGGGVLMALCGHAGFHRTSSGATVLDGIPALVRMAECWVDLARLRGVSLRPATGFYAPPAPSLLGEIRAVYGEAVYPED